LSNLVTLTEKQTSTKADEWKSSLRNLKMGGHETS